MKKSLNFIKQRVSAKHEFREKWENFKNDALNKCYFREDIWENGIGGMLESQRKAKQNILKTLREKYPEAISKKIITRTDSIGFEINEYEFYIISFREKILQLFS